jgi:DNA polymerase III epsilon subunit-like protein
MQIFLDTETTGLDPDHDEILEIAIVGEDGSVLLDTLVRPLKNQSWPEAEEIHGITPAMVENAPTLDELMERIAAVVNGSDLVIYNAGFDMGFLRGLEPASVHCCMLAFAEEYGEWSDYHGNHRWQKLATAARYVYYENSPNHRALADTFACRAVWFYLTNPEERERVNRLRAERQTETQAMEYLRSKELVEWSRDSRYASFMTDFWMRWWLRPSTPDHWSSPKVRGWVRSGIIEEEFAQIFFGRSIAWLEAEDRYPTIHRRKSDIPKHLWPLGRFPKYQWFRDELEESGEAYIHGNMIHPLFHASELDRIKAEFPLRLREPRPCYTASELRRLGFTVKQIRELTPYTEKQNRLSGHWYHLYLKSDIDVLVMARVVPTDQDATNGVHA